ncbi:MAG: TetR/AcrR family transcriptional regulator [Planctomycetes bacterium]|nr:TetR/AcrR family transcriptional regulator [Planctomycetota bacterium]
MSRRRQTSPAEPATEVAATARGGEAGDTRQRLLATAFRLFWEQGYHATGIQTILREADVHAGSLYHFFAAKEALLEGVLEWLLTQLEPRVTGVAAATTKDPVERVFALLHGYRRQLEQSHCELGCPVGNLALEIRDDLPRARALIDRNFAQWHRTVQGWLEDAGDRLPKDLDRPALARMVLTIMEGGMMQARAAQSLQPFDDGVAQLRGYFDLLLAAARRPVASPASRPIRTPRKQRRSR